MHVHARHDVALKIMLEMGELPCEVPHMMIIDKRDGSDRVFILFPLLSDQIVANQVTQRLGTRRVFLVLQMEIERVQQMMIEGDTETNESFHGLLAVLR